MSNARHLSVGVVSLWLGTIGLIVGYPAWSKVVVFGELQTKGHVVGFQDVGRRGKVPVVQYEINWTSYKVTGDPNWRRPGSYSVGESVAVYYEPVSPGSGRIELFWGRWLPALLFGGGGLLLLMLGAGFLWGQRRPTTVNAAPERGCAPGFAPPNHLDQGHADE